MNYLNQPVLTIFYQFNPWQSSVGGIQTVILNFIKYAPDEFKLRLVGTSVDSNESIGQWTTAELAGRELEFLPLLRVENDNVRGIIPTTLRYTLALLGRSLASDFMHFHRLEPALATMGWSGEKTFFVHNDIQKQICEGTENAILWGQFPLLYFMLERFLMGQFDQVLSPHTDSVEFYRKRYPHLASHTSYVKNSVDTQIFYPLSSGERNKNKNEYSQSIGLSPGTPLLLFAGRLHPQKNPILAIRALAALNSRMSQRKPHLLIVGDGELLTASQLEIDRTGLSKQVTLLGSLNFNELADLYRLCDAFVITSAFEAVPIVALEALACGTPVVTTRCGEMPNIITRNNGVLCNESTPSAISEALHKVLMHPENFPAAACTQAAQPYWAKTVITDVFQQMWQRWEKEQDRSSKKSLRPKIKM
ncbi:MAG: glycosyltransferase family 4 protein [Thermosynechococcaceae cyanobacterium]